MIGRHKFMACIRTYWLGAILVTLVLGAPRTLLGDWRSDPVSKSALAFAEEELPEFFREVAVLLRGDPSEALPIVEVVQEIHHSFQRYREMTDELGDIFLSIKRREFQNQVMAEKVHRAMTPESRKMLFGKLKKHMDHTFDLHLKLVRGELVWLEEQVTEVRELIASEERNKLIIMKEDFGSLFLDNEPLLRIMAIEVEPETVAKNSAEIATLIGAMPESHKSETGKAQPE
jgi:NTP pyrophosphatase (non-canonical NTP hydrolase)